MGLWVLFVVVIDCSTLVGYSTAFQNVSGMGEAMGAMDSIMSGDSSSLSMASDGTGDQLSNSGAGNKISGQIGSSQSYGGFGGRRMNGNVPSGGVLSGFKHVVAQVLAPATWNAVLSAAVLHSAQEISTQSQPRFLVGVPAADGGTGGVDPEELMKQGLDVMDVLNMTLIETQNQLVYYKHVSAVMSDVCFDLASLNRSIQLVLYGAIAVLIAEMIVFAYHVKGFTGWSYEIKILGLQQKLFEYEKLEQEREQEDDVVLERMKGLHVKASTVGMVVGGDKAE